MQDSVTIYIDAPVERVWDLVTDITRIGEFSPETFDAEWLDGTGQPTIGARFRGHVKRNQRGPIYWSTCEVSIWEPVRSFGFAVLVRGRSLNNWRYDLESVGERTKITESFRLQGTWTNKLYWSAVGRWRGRTNRNGMRSTLEGMRAVLEA